MSYLKRGSQAARDWAKKMKKARIRAAGKRAEAQFFGPGGEFDDEAAAKARTNPKLSVPEQHMIKIALDTVRHPMKALLGGPSVKEAEEILRRYGISYKKNRTRAASANPITLNGNPPTRINTTVAGILYNRVIEIQAEKTGHGPHHGLWYHPFTRGAGVQLLALDNGDLLVHSVTGKKLWKPD